MTSIQYVTINHKNQYGSESSYPNRQKTFRIHSAKMVQFGCDTIENGVRKNEDISRIFYQLIDTFAQERKKIAIEAGTNEADTFGQRPQESMASFNRYTPLVGPYENTNKKTLENLKSELSSLQHTQKDFIDTTKKVSEFALNRHFSWRYEIISGEEIKKRKWNRPLSPSETLIITKKIGKPKFTENLSQNEVSKMLFDIDAAVKKSFPALHSQDRMHFFLKIIDQVYSSKQNPDFLKSEYVLVTAYTEINHKMVPTNQLLTWVYRNFSDNPFDRMIKHSVLFVLHQDPHLIQESLEECARLFTQIIKEKNSISESDLIEKIALLRYIFAHAMPFQRGSAAIGEWLEGSIYQHLGFAIKSPDTDTKDSTDLAAITSLKFSDYLEKYKEITQPLKIDQENDLLQFWSLD